ncbi:AAA family ATPase [Brachybacterium hainanense]|uniref:AAA family ATPase n=1 Tax=Brachybacterium hainanense TaxID=1541174 RepID=A0ABV6RD38_9MICO
MAATLTMTDEFRQALDLLLGGSNVFLTGRAGTGKSTLVRLFLERTRKRAVTVAPTGIAALNVQGYTIHRLFSFPAGVSEEMVRGPGYFPGRFAKTLAELDVLVVDEASMVRADLFDALAAALERFGPQPGEPFGGVQLVLVGDLYQLPPVVRDAETAFLEERYGSPYFSAARSFDRDVFPVLELTTVFRQQGDARLIELLNQVREGTLLEEARAELNTRTNRDFEPPEDEFWLTLATTNSIVNGRNTRMLERLGTPVRAFAADVRGELDGFERPTEAQLELAEGAQVMLLSNDPGDRWVNGSLGRIARIRADADGPVLDVDLREGDRVEVRPHTWDVTRPVVDGGELRHEVIGTFTQLPVKLAWAITIHKSQGQTLDRVIVDLTGGTFAGGQLYVALSRCTSLAGLVLRRDVLPRDLKTDPRVRRFLTASIPPRDALGEVYLSALIVGERGDRYRPRPVEIAVATDDGDEVTTVVNPTMDLFRAQSEFGITARDVQLAPLLSEAWPALSPLLAGRVPVGVGIDELLHVIDFELKRTEHVEPMPLGVELPASRLTIAERTAVRTGTALDRARAIRDAALRLRREDAPAEGIVAGEAGMLPLLPGADTTFPVIPRGHGFLLARTTGPEGIAGPTGFLVGGNVSAQDDAAGLLAQELERAWSRVLDPDQEAVDRLRAAEAHYGIRVLPEDLALEGCADLSSLLRPGARVCFTGTVHDASRGVLEREEMESIARRHGLQPVANVTKTRTDVLVVAERGSQSNKAKAAARWGKPVVAAEEFLAWAG